MTSITTRLVVATAAALLLGGALRTPVVAIDRPPEEERLERMTTLMDTMHGAAMGMAEEMRTDIRQYREHPCPK